MTDTELEKAISDSQRNLKQQEPLKGTDPSQITAAYTYSGPTPPPNVLIQYEEMVPGIAKKFLEAPHIEATHRRELAKLLVQEKTKLAKRGQLFAFYLAFLSLSLSF